MLNYLLNHLEYNVQSNIEDFKLSSYRVQPLKQRTVKVKRAAGIIYFPH